MEQYNCFVMHRSVSCHHNVSGDISAGQVSTW